MDDTKTKKQRIHIEALWIYPLKGASPIRVESALVDTWGLQYDRIYMLVEQDRKQDNMFKSMSQKRYPKVRREQSTPSRTTLVADPASKPGLFSRAWFQLFRSHIDHLSSRSLQMARLVQTIEIGVSGCPESLVVVNKDSEDRVQMALDPEQVLDLTGYLLAVPFGADVGFPTESKAFPGGSLRCRSIHAHSNAVTWGTVSPTSLQPL